MTVKNAEMTVSLRSYTGILSTITEAAKGARVTGVSRDVMEALLDKFAIELSGSRLDARGFATAWETATLTAFKGATPITSPELERTFSVVVRAVAPERIARKAIRIRKEIISGLKRPSK